MNCFPGLNASEIENANEGTIRGQIKATLSYRRRARATVRGVVYQPTIAFTKSIVRLAGTPDSTIGPVAMSCPWDATEGRRIAA